MLTTTRTAAAANLARKAHSGEIDRTGGPAIEHYLATADALQTEDEVCCALLCDSLSTGRVSASDLEDAGMTADVIEAVSQLARGEGEEFFDYILRVKGNALACRVKRADLAQRIVDMDSYVSLTGMDRRRRTSCQKAIDLIDGVDELAYDGIFESQHHHGKMKTPVPPAPHPPAQL